MTVQKAQLKNVLNLKKMFETKKTGGTNLPPYPHSSHQTLLNFDTVQCTSMYAGFLKNDFFETCSNLRAAFKKQLFGTKKIGGTNLPPPTLTPFINHY